ncbi:MAG: asparagine synthase-related protein [Halioglobus sp.]
MSQVFGIFARSNDMVVSSIDAMALASRSCKPDSESKWSDDRVAIGCQLVWNTPESIGEAQPRIFDLDGQAVVLAVDARLDNRPWLAKELDICDQPISSITDAEFILRGYLHWGEALPQHLLGDFVFAIWDGSLGRLFCARDHLGIKLLHYHISEKQFVFATDIRALRAHPLVGSEIDPETYALYMNEAGPVDPERTFIAAIRKLAPAHSITVTARSHHFNRYWRPEDSPRLAVASDKEYARQLSELLDEAVSCRMRTAYPVACHLSGGLDSSAIAAIAKHHSQNITLKTYNWITAPSHSDDPNCPEWALSQKVADYIQVDHDYITLTIERLTDLLSCHDIADGDSTDLWYEYILREKAVAGKCRTVLSGWGGDEFVSGGGMASITDLFWHGSPIVAIIEIFKAARGAPKPLRRFFGMVYREIIEPCFPWSKGQRFSDVGYLDCASPSFRAFAQKNRSQEVYLPKFSVRKAMLVLLGFGHIQGRVESWAAMGNRKGLEYRYPLLDKRVLEFALGLPPDLFRKGGMNRYIFRQALADILPEAVRFAPKVVETERVTRYCEMYRDFYSSLDLAIFAPEQGNEASKLIDLASLQYWQAKLDADMDDLSEFTHVLSVLSLSYLTLRSTELER